MRKREEQKYSRQGKSVERGIFSGTTDAEENHEKKTIENERKGKITPVTKERRGERRRTRCCVREEKELTG